ncbi:hypothetical protein [Holdemanella sp.]|mgnify:CR=1 FL=1|uniref:hypothetical protein n=1 Tax=Holdemanella sp. TaxID=1971762 RepID=UPI003AEF649A
MDFFTLYNQISNNQKCLITNMMIHMEHNIPPSDIEIIHGIKYGLLNKELSETNMISQISKIYAKKYNIYDSSFSVENTYNSMIKRNSRKSKLYPIVLNFLEINEDIINTCYYSTLNLTELFSSLSARNQSAILYLMKNLDTKFSINSIHDNIGIK